MLFEMCSNVLLSIRVFHFVNFLPYTFQDINLRLPNKRVTKKSEPSTVLKKMRGNERICHACLLPGKVTKGYYDVHFHDNCYNSTVRNIHATLKEHAETEHAGKELVKEETEKMRKRPGEWREDVKPFIPGQVSRVEKNMAQKSLRDRAKSFTVHQRVDKKLMTSGKLKFRRRHFVRHWKRWECSDTEVCNNKFDELHDAQGSGNDLSEPVVECDNPEIREDRITGHETLTGVGSPPPFRSISERGEFPVGIFRLELSLCDCMWAYCVFFFPFWISFCKSDFP